MFYLISPLAWQFILGMLPSVFNLSRFDTLKIFDHVVGFFAPVLLSLLLAFLFSF